MSSEKFKKILNYIQISLQTEDFFKKMECLLLKAAEERCTEGRISGLITNLDSENYIVIQNQCSRRIKDNKSIRQICVSILTYRIQNHSHLLPSQ